MADVVAAVTPGGVFQYAQDSNRALFAIERYELDTGETLRVTGGNPSSSVMSS